MFDGVNKGYVDNITSNLLTKAELDVNITLPGIPLTDDLVMAFVPTLKSLDFERNNKANNN